MSSLLFHLFAASQCEERWKYLRKRYTRSPHSSWDLAPYLSFLEPLINRKPKKDKTDLPDDSTSVTNNLKSKNIDFIIEFSTKKLIFFEIFYFSTNSQN